MPQLAATMTFGRPGTLHGMETLVLQGEDGEPGEVHSIASGLDYPGVGPQHVHLRELGRVEAETVEAVVRQQLSRALGGRRGMAEAAVPTILFTVTWLTQRDLDRVIDAAKAVATFARAYLPKAGEK